MNLNDIKKKYVGETLSNTEADYVIGELLGISQAEIIISKNELLPEDKALMIIRAFQQITSNTPIAYVLGYEYFYGNKFIVNSSVLIPRTDTEVLIDVALKELSNKSNPKILDLGTGSGIIAITLSQKLPNADITAIDISSESLECAKINANNLLGKEHNINFIQSNWFDSLGQNQFDLIISNPPYIEENDPHLLNLRHEPIRALVAKKHGLQDLEHIIINAKKYLNNAGFLILEHGYNQHILLQKLLFDNHYTDIHTYNDLNNPRCTIGKFFFK